jgi:diguanylate cyclase (GGDEF)-like protein
LFRVKAANNDGVWNEEGAVMAVHVEPAPWLTPWAYTLYAVLVALFMLFAARMYRARTAVAALQREELERQVQQRTSELGDRNRQLEDLNGKLMQASFTDSLTGLYNRRYLDQFIDAQVGAIDRESHERRQSDNANYFHYQQSVLFFMMIDLDGFKAINDTYGHTAGDRALLQVRDELLDCTRKSDTVIRWGGDEFLIIGHTKGLSGIANFAERVRLAVTEHVYHVGNGQCASLSCSVGAVPYPFAPLKSELLNWEQSLNVADSAAYIVKSNGRNGWVLMSGNHSISLEEATKLPGNIEALIADSKLQISTSLQEPIALVSNRESVA